MKCDGRDCPNEATSIRAVPLVGDTLCFCETCKNDEISKYNQDFGWEPLTPEEAVLEEEAREHTWAAVASIARQMRGAKKP